MRRVTIFIMSCILFSCSGKNKVPTGIIPQKEMQNILWDVIRAQAMAEEVAQKDSSINKPAETKALMQKVFEIHKIKSLDFDESYNWYTNHPEIMRLIFDSLNVQKRKNDNDIMKEKFKLLKKDSSKLIL